MFDKKEKLYQIAEITGDKDIKRGLDKIYKQLEKISEEQRQQFNDFFNFLGDELTRKKYNIHEPRKITNQMIMVMDTLEYYKLKNGEESPYMEHITEETKIAYAKYKTFKSKNSFLNQFF